MSNINGIDNGFHKNNNPLFNSISELNSPEFIYSKFDLSNDFDLEKCKKALFYVFGYKIKKKQIREVLKIKNREFINSNCMSLNEYKTVYNYFKNESDMVSNHEMLFNFYNHLINNKIENTLNFNLFYTKIKEYLSFLNDSYIQEIFLTIDKDKDGVIRISDLENYFF
jgi:hypothetical protein